MANPDFIPEGEDSAYQSGSYKDFVPTVEPSAPEEIKKEIEEVVVEKKKRKRRKNK